MGLAEIIQKHKGKLTPADERLVSALLAEPVAASFLAASEIAERAGVHEATAVRLAQKLGFRGYPELRAALQAELITDVKPAERMQRRLAQTGQGTVLNRLVEDEIASLQELTRHVGQEQLETAAHLLYQARRVFIFSYGNAMALAELMDRRLRRSGCATLRLPDSVRDMAEHVVSLRNDDLVLAFALRTRPPLLEPLLQYTEQLGCPSVLVSDTIGPLIRPQPQVLLAAPRGPTSDYQTLTVPMAVCNALVVTLAQIDNGRSLESLQKLEGLFQDFEKKG
ncbi:MAG: MurR/RpiR family transcriptional regulator [Chloroflexaceae bacterium]|jgi:DNA-binding MurR/RpiR family transcriptional regulator|nr:MurR/RpiR family transcriptional regulator [Chloroflexaceae bacterium]